MTRNTLPVLLAATALSSGCFLLPESELTEVLPDDRIQVNMPLASELAKDGDKEWSTFYLWTAEVTEDVNWMAGIVLFWVDTITTQHRPTYANADQSEAIWGPWSEGPLDPVETQLRVSHDLETDAYAWGFERWSKDETVEDAVAVVAGEVDPGATREASTGRFVVDFDTINEMDPTEEATGTFTVDYDIDPDGVVATAAFEDFGPDGIDADYAYEQIHGGEGSMDLVVEADLDPTTGMGLAETLAIHSRWLADGSGRADVVVRGGDLGEVVGYASECWNSSFEAVYYVEDHTGYEDGDASLCAFDSPEYPVNEGEGESEDEGELAE